MEKKIMKDVKVSVVVPMYNSENYIIRALESVRNQTFDLDILEVIVVNDGSTDNSRLVVEKYIEDNHSYFNIVLINKNNGGVSSARNAGMEVASGSWIAFLDADDAWHPEKLKHVVDFLSDEYDLYGHDWQFTYQPVEPTIAKPIPTIRIPLYKLLLKNHFQTSSVLIKKSLLFDENFTHTEDHDLWVRICRDSKSKAGLLIKSKLMLRDRPVLSPGGASEKTWEMRKGEIKMYWNFCKKKFFLVFLFPALLSFSLFNHLRKKLNNVRY